MENEAAVCREARLRGQSGGTPFVERIFGQKAPVRLTSLVLPMSLSFARKAAICFCWGLFLIMPAAVFAQTNYYGTNGTEYAIVGSLPGDQVWPDVAVTTNGGFVVWQDNATDGSGWGVSARKLDGTLSGTLSTFRVNATGTNDQENARVALLKNGGAVFAWQGGVEGFQHIYARFLTPTNTWLTSTDVVVSVPVNNFQINPSVAVLNNSNVVVVWSSFNEARSNSMQDVYAKILSPTGQTVSNEFLVNQFTSYNQRTPVVAALANGGFVVAWVSEQERILAPNLGTGSTNNSSLPTYTSPTGIVTPSVDIYARLFNSSGAPAGNEFLVNSSSFPCANPDLAAGSDGGFMVVWGAHDMVNVNNSWDIYARSYSGAGVGGTVGYVNTTLYGDQYAPHISSIGTDYLVLWTSLGQDGSREGVYGQYVHAGGALVGGEFLVNTTTAGQQMQPSVASDGQNQFLAVWTSSMGFSGPPYDFNLFAQRYINVNMASNLPPLGAPFVWAPFVLNNGVYQPQLQVSWAMLSGISVSSYQIHADGTNSPTALVSGATNQWMMTTNNGLVPSSTHSFRVAYIRADGRQSPLSVATTNSTWSGLSWGGIPYEWMAALFGGYFNGTYHTNFWPAATSPAASGGPTLLQVFLTGGNPFDSSTWLQQALTQTSQGMFLSWNTQPGLTYQVQVKTNLSAAWSNLGSPRFAAGTNDSIYVGGSPAGFYQIEFLH
jgi:hypothetical protein